MQRTQIYLEESMIKELKIVAKSLNQSVSELIRIMIKKEIKKMKKDKFVSYLQQMKPIDSFRDVDATKYVEEIRDKSRILGE